MTTNKKKDWKNRFESLPAINTFLYHGVVSGEPNIEIGGIVHLKLWQDAKKQIISFIEGLINNPDKMEE